MPSRTVRSLWTVSIVVAVASVFSIASGGALSYLLSPMMCHSSCSLLSVTIVSTAGGIISLSLSITVPIGSD